MTFVTVVTVVTVETFVTAVMILLKVTAAVKVRLALCLERL